MTDPDLSINIKTSTGHTFEAHWNGETAPCRGCGKPIGFALTKKRKWLPIDVPDDPNEPAEAHFATCPKAKEFRK
jgi:hypothetical protein